MEFGELSSLWNTIDPPAKTAAEIRGMLKENRHPVLKGIRKQVMIELIGWLAFLTCYYTMFDGQDKPLLINIALIVAVLMPTIHNFYSYNFARYLPDAGNIRDSLEAYIRRMEVYAIRSISTRVVFTCGLMLFFSYNPTFSTSKYLLLAAVTCLLIMVQLIFLSRIWKKRIETLRRILKGFSD